MNDGGKLNIALKELVNKFSNEEKRYSSICKVLSIDTTKRTCQLEPINGDAERKGRLQASVELSTGIYIKPTVNSYVLLSFINNQTGVITQYSEVDEITINQGTDFAVRYNELESAYNQLKSDHDDLVQAFNTHVHATAAPGAPSPPTPAAGIPASASTGDISGAKINEIKLP